MFPTEPGRKLGLIVFVYLCSYPLSHQKFDRADWGENDEISCWLIYFWQTRRILFFHFWLSIKIPVFHFPTTPQNFGISFFCYVASFLVEEEWGLEQFVLLMGSRLALTNSLQILFFTVNLQFGHSGRKVGTVVWVSRPKLLEATHFTIGRHQMISWLQSLVLLSLLVGCEETIVSHPMLWLGSSLCVCMRCCSVIEFESEPSLASQWWALLLDSTSGFWAPLLF